MLSIFEELLDAKEIKDATDYNEYGTLGL